MSQIEGNAGSGLKAIQKLAPGYVDAAVIRGAGGETKARTDPGVAPEIYPNAEPLVRLVLDSAAVVALKTFIGLKVADPSGGRQIGERFRVLAQ